MPKHKPNILGAGHSLGWRVNTPLHWNRVDTWFVFWIIITCVILGSIGIGWGRSGFVPWQADSIEGITTVREMPKLFGEWTYKYPQGQFLINAIFYKPLMKKWAKDPVPVFDRRIGVKRYVALTQPRLDVLATISRWITLFMSVGTAIAAYAITRELFADRLAGLLAGLSLAVSALFVFYSHVGNVDIPCVFWYAWGNYWLVKSIKVGKRRHFVLMAFCFSYSICTKDAMVGFLIGIVLVYIVAIIGKSRQQGHSFREFLSSLFCKRVLLAIVVFFFVYALLQGIFTSPSVFAQRMSHWLGGSGVTNFNKSFSGQWPLFLKSCKCLYTSFGWPLLALVCISLAYYSFKCPYQAVIGTIPIAVFYVLVVMNVRMAHPRYFLPAFVGLVVFAGKAGSEFVRRTKGHIALRIAPLLLVYGLSALYCVGLDLEMLRDPRVQAEKWFANNVKKNVSVACITRKFIYAPRLHIMGFPYLCPWKVPQPESIQTSKMKLPKYVIFIRCSDEEDRNFQVAREQGMLKYVEVVRFNNNYIWPARSVFGIASWGVKLTGFIDRGPVIIYENKPAASDT